ncbi:resistance to lethality of mkk1p386 overexpression [Recurvomyces mirabilis]|nr:resistance to lethality of mkk1p386 overexpression [Recurvomyces mirabilis]
MGRRKIEIKPIRDDRNRSVTFLKRKGGLFKKAHELSVLCSVDVAVIIFGHNKKLYEYSSSDINEIIGRFQYYGGAHEHKGPADFADKGGGDDDEDDEGGEEGDEQRNTPVPPDAAMMHAQMQNHPGFQHVRHGTPSGSPPMHNGAMPPQFVRGPSPLPPGISRPSSRAQQHPGHVRRVSSNLAPPHMQPSQGPPQQPNYAYTPNPPFYNPQAAAAAQAAQAAQMQQRPVQQGHQATYPPPYAQAPPQHPQIQQAFIQEQRRSSGPPAFPPQPPPQANMSRHPSTDHLQPPQPRPHPSPQPQQGLMPPRATPSPQPHQHQFASPHIPQPRPLPAAAKAQSIFTPIDDSRSMLAQHWGSNIDPRIDPAIKLEDAPRSASVDVAVMQRGNPRSNGTSPKPPPARMPKSPQPPQRAGSTASMPAGPTRTSTMQSDAKRPRLKVQIPSEQSGDEGGTASAPGDSGTAQPAANAHQPPHDRVVLPPPSPSAGALLSAGAQGPPNPFARPAPPMSTNPHAMNRDANHIETPISALPSRFMSDNLLPSPSQFYPEFFGGRSADSNLLPSPLNFQTPIIPNGQGWREEDRKRQSEDGDGGSDVKRAKT